MTTKRNPLQITKMAASIQPSATLAAAAKARQMKAEGIEVVDFSLGEPDFATPEHICKAAFEAVRKGHTHYTPANGIIELRRAIASMYDKTHGLKISPEQVLVSNGAKHSIHNVLASLCTIGDEVIIPAPYWVSYSDLVEMTGAAYRLVPTSHENGFKMTAAQLMAAITPKSKLLMLNSPGNPTGAVYSRSELLEIADIVMDSGLAVLSDEIYERLVYGEAKSTCFATLRPGLAEQTVTISGVSKSYAMTGWRIGWAVGPQSLIKVMGNVQSQETSCPSSVSQHAAVAALEGDQACVEVMRKEFQARRDMVCARLSAMPGIVCPVPPGAFYAFFHVAAHFGKSFGGTKVEDSASFCAAALAQARVNLVQGSAFGAEGYARLSYATSPDLLKRGLDQLESWLRQSA